MTKEQTTYQSSESRKSQAELQNRYGRIAISAVAAALPYGSDSKKPERSEPETRN